MDIELLNHLTQTFGPSGYEDRIRAVIKQAIVDHVDEWRVDPLGSLVAFKKGNGGGQRILLAAHMDEIGFMVTHVEAEGYVRFTSMGGLRPANLLSSRVQFADGAWGVISVERREDATVFPSLNHLYLDVGSQNRESCPIQVGTPGVFVGPLIQQNSRLISKAMDDRIGCYVLIQVLRQLSDSPHDVYFLFSTQEEITLAGARTSAYRVHPDLAISVDVTTTGDTPKAIPMDVSLGKGPAVKVKDGGMVAHPRVRDMLVDAAERAKLPYQMEVLVGGTTDAAVMQVAHEGVPSGCLSIPCRYVHSTSEMIDQNDVENAVAVFLEALK